MVLLLVLSSLGWFALVLASLASTVIAFWVALALARHAQATSGAAASATGPFVLALLVTIALPLIVAVWRHQGDLRRVLTTMAWLPAAWNTGGLLIAGQLVPDVAGTALRSHGAWIAAEQLGDTHTGTRVLSALGHNTADWVRPTADAAPVEASPAAELSLRDEDDAITVPFSSEGNAILMDVEVFGPAGTLTVPYLFDTGASFTTINTSTAKKLGIEVPEDAPTLKFNTASGPREGQMVYLPAIKMRNVTIEGLLVSVCDGCVNERSAGLLGLNVMREFIVHIDFPNHIRLLPRARQTRPNRAYDINPTVEFEVERPEIWLGRVRWIVQIQNRGTEPIRDVIPEVRFSDGQRLRGAKVDVIEPGASGESLVEGRATTEEHDTELGFVISLVEAYW